MNHSPASIARHASTRGPDSAIGLKLVRDEKELIQALIHEIHRLKQNSILCRKIAKRTMISVYQQREDPVEALRDLRDYMNDIIMIVDESEKGDKEYQ
jgi:LPS sulfotransferase NodH